MASKTFSGQLDQAMNEAAAEGNKILFIPQQTVGEVLPGAASELVVESDGTYSIKLAYNTYSIYHYSDVTKRKTLLANDIVVSTDTAVTTIPDLLGSVVPVTEDSVLTIQGYLDEANQAKTDAETAQAETEALFDDFDSSVADSMALVHTDTPTLSIPFNESGRLDYGIGTEYVSGLPVYGVDFTRSTTSNVINKSGTLESLAADEVAIGADGAWFHGAYTNLINYSDDLTGTGWTRTSVNVTSDASEIFGKSASYLQGDGTGDASTSVYYSLTGLSASSVNYTATFFARIANYNNLYCGVYDITNAAWIINAGTNYVDLSDGIDHEIELNFTKPASCTALRVYVMRMVEATDMDAYVSSVQLTATTSKVPFIATSGATASATPATCTAPANGNLPATGGSLTFTFDTKASSTSSDTRSILSITNALANGKFSGITLSSASMLIFRSGSSGSGDVQIGRISSNSEYAEGGVNRVTCVYDYTSGTVTGYVNGEPLSYGPIDVSGMELPSDGLLTLGATSGTWYLNSQIKNFKILPYAASADEVKSWGAPK